MHVGLIAPEFPPDVGGVERYSHGLAHALAAKGIEVTVLTRPHRDGEVALEGVRVRPWLRLRRSVDAKVLKSLNVDLWHATNAAYAWVAELGVPTFVSVHGNDFLDPYVLVGTPCWGWRYAPKTLDQWMRKLAKQIGRRATRRLVRTALPRVDGIIANSRYTERILTERVPDCAGKTAVGYVGVPEESFTDVPRRCDKAGPWRLVTISRLSESRKNVDRVIRALARLSKTHDFTLTVIGEGKARGELSTLARELGLSDRISLPGPLADEEVRECLASSDLFVLTASATAKSHEGLGIVYLEAAACGVPALAARNAGAQEAVVDGSTGFFVEETSIDAICTALDGFMQGRHRFDPEACRQHARGFTWTHVADVAEKMYERALPSRGPATAARPPL